MFQVSFQNSVAEWPGVDCPRVDHQGILLCVFSHGQGLGGQPVGDQHHQPVIFLCPILLKVRVPIRLEDRS